MQLFIAYSMNFFCGEPGDEGRIFACMRLVCGCVQCIYVHKVHVCVIHVYVCVYVYRYMYVLGISYFLAFHPASSKW